jgi:hypothetical protein
VSALPTTIAETLKARAFAVTVGDDEFAVVDVLSAAADLLELAVADCVIGIFCSAEDGITGLAHSAGILKARPTECAIAMRITSQPHHGSIRIQPSQENTEPSVVLDASSIVSNGETNDLTYGPATGAVLVHQISGMVGSDPIDVGIRNDRGNLSLRLSRSI